MSYLGVSFISRLFAVFALFICFYSFFISTETAVKTQAIYWFCAALVSAIIPYVKEIAVYIESIKVGDLEIALNEVKQELKRVDNKVEKLDDRLLSSLSQIRQNEASLSREARESRQRIYDESAQALAMLPPNQKIKLQERLTRNHLDSLDIDISTLKDLLRKLGYYQSVIDEVFSPDLVQAIERFQTENLPGPPDGIVGPVTLSKISELIHLQ